MSRIVTGKCKKCGGYCQFDIGSMTKEEAEEALKANKSWQCTAGNHVELISPYDLYTFDWDNIKEAKSMSSEEFFADLKTKFKEVYTSDEFGEKYTVDGFMAGRCLCHPKDGDEDAMIIFDFTHGPKGERYYFLVI
jgi:hypothetical protein